MIDYAQMEAVSAVLRLGSFDKAARSLNLTPSAISQRVKALEDQLGIALIVREKPCRPTEAGSIVTMHFERVSLLQQSLENHLSIRSIPNQFSSIRIAVNADSLETWFLRALSPTWYWLYDIITDDQNHSSEWLRKGMVTAAVTADDTPPPGYDSSKLGSLRYWAVCQPSFREKWLPDGLTAAAINRAPAIAYGSKDELHILWLSSVLQIRLDCPFHQLPSPSAITSGLLLGLGWGLVPELLVLPYLNAGKLVHLAPKHPLDVPLFWQWPRVVQPSLLQINKSIISTARQFLK